MVLELAVLHVLDKRQVEFWDVVLVHVKEDVSDHDDALFDLLPDSIEFLEKLLIFCLSQIVRNWLQ